MSIMLAMMLNSAVAFDPETSVAWAEFAVRPSRSHRARKVEIGTIPGRTVPGDYVYWLRLTESNAGRETVSYADTRTCDAAKAVIGRMENLSIAQGAAPHNWDSLTITADGAQYSVRMPVRYGGTTGEVALSTNVGTPVAQFVDESLAALRDCWSPELPPAR